MNKLVLVIEDDESTALFLSRALTSDGFRVRAARTAPEGIGLALRERPNLIISDVHLEGLDGPMAVAQMRKYPCLRTTPVILISSIPARDLRARKSACGAQGMLVKPFRVGHLLRRVRRWIGTRESA